MYQQKDYYFNKAKKEGLRARSSYKLIEIQKKYKLMKTNDNVLDIACAPGSWLQVIKKFTHGRIVGVDLESIKPIDGIEFIQGDIRDKKIQRQIGNNYQVVLSDIAPKTTGIRDKDQYLSLELSRVSFLVAKEVLQKGGNFLVKTFQSQETEELVKEIKKEFDFVKRYSPASSREGSKEIYILATGYKGKKINSKKEELSVSKEE
ncbi:RlmE family RNA methyltransferase [Candidatus Woesearchaeota archaeon]|nr:RlmE family RNA methyltransferase [Candidatus Woesearchaeota archaeon]